MTHALLVSFLVNSINTRLLAGYVKQKGHAATCLYCPQKPTPSDLSALSGFLAEKTVDLVGLSLVTDDYPAAVTVTKAIRDVFRGPMLWGGAHANVKPEECLEHADIVCLGEGEEALLELMDSLGRDPDPDIRIRNLWFNSPDGILKNDLRPLEEDLDRYPYPDSDLRHQFVLRDGGVLPMLGEPPPVEYSIITSRGCPYNCHYCYNSYRRSQYAGKGRYLRKRSIDNVIGELKGAKNRNPGLRKINFWDDSFVARPIEEFERFRDLYREHVGLPFFALIEPMVFHADKMKILKDCGLCALQVGIQTGSETVNRSIYNRNITNERVLDVARQIRELDVAVVYDVIFNNPYESEEDVAQTVRLLSQFPRPCSIQGFNLIFYPGTRMTENAIRDGYITPCVHKDETHTIEGAKDSPIANRGKSILSNRFYQTHYTPEGKEYWHKVLSLLGHTYPCPVLIRYFARSKSWLKEALLDMYIGLYALAHRVRLCFRRHYD